MHRAGTILERHRSFCFGGRDLASNSVLLVNMKVVAPTNKVGQRWNGSRFIAHSHEGEGGTVVGNFEYMFLFLDDHDSRVVSRQEKDLFVCHRRGQVQREEVFLYAFPSVATEMAGGKVRKEQCLRLVSDLPKDPRKYCAVL